MSEPVQVLLIEDNRADADIIKELLKDTGVAHSLTWLDDGEKAMGFFDDMGKADLIIVDLKLPIFSGHEIIASLRDRGVTRTTPVVALTGSNSPSDRERAKNNGVVCYLIKPMTVEEMEQMTQTFKELFLGERSCGH